jgi:hypothetical protein
MDIVVTIPKTEYENDDKENIDIITKGYTAFWTFKRNYPKKLKTGNRIYFVKHNQVDSSMLVTSFSDFRTGMCVTTNREWKGKIVLLDDLRDEKQLDIKIKGFQGFRYKWWKG